MSDNQLSGRELDAAVAERVFGWERMPNATALAPYAYRRPDGHIVHPYSAPNYSESIEAAMRVLAQVPIWNINKTDHPDFADRPYSIAVSIHESEHSSRVKTFEVQAETVEIGICRAALKAAQENQK